MEVELNLVDADGRPALRNAEVLDRIDDPPSSRARPVQPRDQRAAAQPGRRRRRRATRHEVRDQLNAANDRAHEVGAGHGHDRHPADPRPGAPDPRSRSAATRGTRCWTSRCCWRAARTCTSRSAAPEALETWADSIAPGGGLHQRAVPPAGQPGRRSRRTGTPRSAWPRVQVALGGEQPVLPRPRALARDPDRGVHPGRRHPAGRAEGAGRTAAGLVRRALDHQRVRPVRGEHALLPRAAAGARRRGPGRRSSTPAARPTLARAAAAQRHRSGAGTGRCTTSSTARRTCGSRTACCPPVRRSSTSWPTARSTSARCGCWPSRTGRCGRRCRSRRPRRTSPRRRSTASTPSVYWPGSGEVPVTELVLRRLLPLAHEGLRAWGVDDAIRERLLGIIEARCTSGRNGATWQVDAVHRLEAAGCDRREALRRMTQAYVAPDAQQRARPHLAGRRSTRSCPRSAAVHRARRPPAGVITSGGGRCSAECGRSPATRTPWPMARSSTSKVPACRSSRGAPDAGSWTPSRAYDPGTCSSVPGERVAAPGLLACRRRASAPSAARAQSASSSVAAASLTTGGTPRRCSTRQVAPVAASTSVDRAARRARAPVAHTAGQGCAASLARPVDRDDVGRVARVHGAEHHPHRAAGPPVDPPRQLGQQPAERPPAGRRSAPGGRCARPAR